MGVFVQLSDLEDFADIPVSKAEKMIRRAEAQARLVAPCLRTPEDLSEDDREAVTSILCDAILRWNDAGSGAVSQQTAGPFSQTMDTRQTRRSLFWPSEIDLLQKICSGDSNDGAFSIDTLGGAGGPVHADICSLHFGAGYCSCGADLTRAYPLYETGGA